MLFRDVLHSCLMGSVVIGPVFILLLCTVVNRIFPAVLEDIHRIFGVNLNTNRYQLRKIEYENRIESSCSSGFLKLSIGDSDVAGEGGRFLANLTSCIVRASYR